MSSSASVRSALRGSPQGFAHALRREKAAAKRSIDGIPIRLQFSGKVGREIELQRFVVSEWSGLRIGRGHTDPSTARPVPRLVSFASFLIGPLGVAEMLVCLLPARARVRIWHTAEDPPTDSLTSTPTTKVRVRALAARLRTRPVKHLDELVRFLLRMGIVDRVELPRSTDELGERPPAALESTSDELPDLWWIACSPDPVRPDLRPTHGSSARRVVFVSK